MEYINKNPLIICVCGKARSGKSTVSKYLENNGAKLITMIRFEVGEGMEKRQENFAEEVMNQINN